MASKQKPGPLFERNFLDSVPKDTFKFKLRTPPRPAFGLKRAAEHLAAIGTESWVTRELSMASRFTPSSPFDVILWDRRGLLHCLELKRVATTSLPFSGVRDSQVKGLANAKEKGAVAGFVVLMPRLGESCWFLDIADFVAIQEAGERKSVSMSQLRAAHEIPLDLKRRGRRWDVAGYMEAALSWNQPEPIDLGAQPGQEMLFGAER